MNPTLPSVLPLATATAARVVSRDCGSGSTAASHPPRRRSFWRWLAALVGLLATVGEGLAIPYYARSTGLSCVDCHVVVPKLNAFGEAFLARGYRLGVERERSPAAPISVWITGRYEGRSAGGLDEFFLPKVEFVSGGPVADLPFSYFLEWRVVSLELRNNGTLRDRGGRFEDAFLNWEINDRHAVRFGQFRAVNQYDVSLRLSVSEPALFSTSLAGRPDANGRITSLRAFSPSGRSPGVAYGFQSIKGATASDGLFHGVNLPFVGELSLPLGDEARREASFELEGPVKGVFLETFYRQGLNSIGAHAFLDDNRRLVTGVGRVHYRDIHATAGVGVDDASGRASRMRYSLETEYLWSRYDRVRPGVGFRVEQVTNAGRDPAYIPYFVVSGPNTDYSFVLQVEGRFQGGSRTLFLDLSMVF